MNNVAEDDNAANDPNSIKTGQFMIEKADRRKLENYPIWRLEGPNMLRKFEMAVSDGKIVHKSLYAYSSWAQSMMDSYLKISVTQVSSHDGEVVVQVKKEFVPEPPTLDSLEQYSSDVLYEAYCVLVKALFHQAIDNGFLQKIKSENDLQYLNPINNVDSAITEHVEKIESLVSMKEEFKTRVKNCPNMKSIRRQNWTQTDQATLDKSSEKGVRSVLMFGYGYDPFLLTEDKSRGVEVAQEIVVGSTMDKYLASYHGLYHFKITMMKRCADKLKYMKAMNPKLSEEEAMNASLEDKVWLLTAFEDLKLLMKLESDPPASS